MTYSHEYHNPVMVNECLSYLPNSPFAAPKKRNKKHSSMASSLPPPHDPFISLDFTLGGGGHTLAILNTLKLCLLPPHKFHHIGFDQDEEALSTATHRVHQEGLELATHQSNFADVTPALLAALHPASDSRADYILMDLGVSSHQIDDPSRGFSHSRDGVVSHAIEGGKGEAAPLDMRMSDKTDLTAAHICNTYPESALISIFRTHGDEAPSTAGKIATAIVASRPHKSTADLTAAVASVVPAWHKTSPRLGLTKTLSRIFQSLRVVVNAEDTTLASTLAGLPTLLRPGGVCVVLTYQSMEDRLVKSTFKDLIYMDDGSIGRAGVGGADAKDMYGNSMVQRVFTILNKGQTATSGEVEANGRARSARLRVARLNPPP